MGTVERIKIVFPYAVYKLMFAYEVFIAKNPVIDRHNVSNLQRCLFPRTPSGETDLCGSSSVH